jgi:hypothetical protein
MQVKIADVAPATTFNLTRLQNAFKHNTTGTGVFESGQHPIIVGQAAYNSAYGTSFASSSNCNGGSTSQRCDGLARVHDTTTFGFNTLSNPNVKMQLHVEPKAIHDETNATTFDEFGRMQANLGVEAQPPTPGQQNVTLYPFVNPATEIINATNLPKADVTFDANGKPVSDVKITPLSDPGDGTQIWRITHNGVDTHPIHFHLYDVQLVNRVTWDNIIIPTDATELGWKDTIRVAPLEDTIVALRPTIPELPWEIPNAIRLLNPMMMPGSTAMFNNIDIQGNPTDNIINQLVNFGWEYVYHCHILSHEEMDMMRPVSVALPPVKPNGLAATVSSVVGNPTVTLNWNDNSIAETAYLVQRMVNGSGTWTDLQTIPSPLDQANTKGTRTFVDTAVQLGMTYQYQIVAQNTVGYGGEYPAMTVKSTSDPLTVEIAAPALPAAPSNLAATAVSAIQVNLTWTDNANNEAGFTIERAPVTGGVPGQFTPIDGVGADITTYSDPAVTPNTAYAYRVFAFNGGGNSQPSNVATVTTPLPGPNAPSNVTAVLLSGPTRVQLTWIDTSNNENQFRVFRSTNGGAFAQIGTVNRTTGQRISTGGMVTFNNTTNLTAGSTYAYYVIAVNTVPNPDLLSVPSNTASAIVPTLPAAPGNLAGSAVRITGNNLQDRATLTWRDNANNETGFQIQRSTSPNFTNATTYNVGADVTTFTQNVSRSFNFYYRVRAVNAIGNSAWSNVIYVTTP